MNRGLWAFAISVAAFASSCTSKPGTADGSMPADGSTPGDGGPGGGADGGLALSDLGGVYANDVCLYLTECQRAQYCSPADCAQTVAPFGLSTLEAEVDAGWVSYSPSAAAACDAKFESDPCSFGFFFVVPEVQQVLAACPGVFTGQRQAGQTCASVADCAGATECLFPTNSCPGTCTAYLEADAGCAVGTTADCDPAQNLYCVNGVCRPPAKVGDPCTSSPSCFNNGAHLWCNIDAGVCQPLAMLGQACQWLGGAQAPECVSGLWCSAWNGVGTCMAKSDAGGPCLTLDVNGDCVPPFVCVSSPDAGAGDGVCAPAAGDGGRCDSAFGCQSGLWCSGGTCVPLPGLGAPCAGSFQNQCAPGFVCGTLDGGSACLEARCFGQACNDGQGSCEEGSCVAGQCTAPYPLGHACSQGPDCASGQCSANTCVDPRACAL